MNKIYSLMDANNSPYVSNILVTDIRNDIKFIAVKNYMDYICSETLTATLSLVDTIASADKQSIEIIDGMPVDVWVRKA